MCYIDIIVDCYIENLDFMLVYCFDCFGWGGYYCLFNDVGFVVVCIMEINENYN